MRMFSRELTSSAVWLAKAPAKPLGGKTKVKQGFKLKSDPKTKKVKKGGSTHLKFRDAVRALLFDKKAVSFDTLAFDSLQFPTLAANKHKVVQYEAATEPRLRALNMFRKYQHHEAFSKPVSMVTNSTVRLADTVLAKMDGPSAANRVCLVGDKGAGKSVLLLQISGLAASKYQQNVVVLSLDYPELIMHGSSDYAFNKKTGQYQQQMFTKRWVRRCRDANEAVFKTLKLSKDITFAVQRKEVTLTKENTLHELLSYNVDYGKHGTSEIFQFVVGELQHHAAQVPVLVTMDNFNAFTHHTDTAYRHPDFRPIQVGEFEMGAFFLRVASGELSFAKGAVVLAESKDVGYSHTLPVALKQQEYDPYWKHHQCDRAVADQLMQNGGIAALEVQNMTLGETRGLMEFWEAAGVLQVRPYPTKADHRTSEQLVKEREQRLQPEADTNGDEHFDSVVHSHYMLSAGNPGHLMRAVNMSF